MTSAEQIAEALNIIGPHTFRDGKVLASIENFNANNEMLSIDITTASYDNINIPIESTIHWSNYQLLEDNPVTFAYKLIGSRVRELANGII